MVIFVDLAYSEHQETEMLAVFTCANELGFEPGLSSPEQLVMAVNAFRWLYVARSFPSTNSEDFHVFHLMSRQMIQEVVHHLLLTAAPTCI